MIERIKELYIKYKEIINYLFFGGCTTVVNFVSYYIPSNLLGIDEIVSNIIAWIVSVLFAYITNKLWVFESKSWSPTVLLKEIGTFVASRGVTGVIEIVTVPLLVKTTFDNLFYNIIEKIGLSMQILFTDGIYSKIVVSFIIVVLNYVFSKLFVFKNKKDDNKKEDTEEIWNEIRWNCKNILR